ncbi:hypothetical protein DMH27_26325 [Raoultella planticola]|nr:hypothetical protein [Raoultella planticola]
MLRFLTCGSVDDGKSTLIGRLLHDTRQIYEDQLSSLHNDSKRHGTQGENWIWRCWWMACRLSASRASPSMSPIAISLPRNANLLSPTPGARAVHPQYATGASTCDLAILLMDARKGVLDQTRRHSFISTLLGIKTWWWR